MFKNCCGMNKLITKDEQAHKELERVLSRYYETMLSPAEYDELHRYLEEWQLKLGRWLNEDELQSNVMDYYFFIVRRDLWRRHLVRALNRTQKRQVRTVLRSWQNAFILLAEVAEAREGYYVVNELLGEGVYSLEQGPVHLTEGQLIFSICLVEDRSGDMWIQPISGMTIVNQASEQVAEEVRILAEKSGQTNSLEFFKAYILDIYEMIFQNEVKSVDDVVERLFTPQQKEVVDILEDKLRQDPPQPGVQGMLTSLLAFYFAKEEPKFRKPEVLAAAAFQLAADYRMLPDEYTQAEVSRMFNVSVSSFKRHTDALELILLELENTVEERQQPQPAFYVGTDPRPTERTNWQIQMHSMDQEFNSFEEAQAYLQEAIKQPFVPADAEQEAQDVCYEAYAAEDEATRRRLARKAYEINPENVDALMLRAEMTDDPAEIEDLYKRAIANGKQRFDKDTEEIWGIATNRPYLRALFNYGVWLFEEQQMDEAAEIFLKLLCEDRHDHQGARYFAAASLIHAGQLEEAQRVLEAYVPNEGEVDAIYLFLEWLLEMDLTEGDSPRGDALYDQAHAANIHVDALIEKADEKMRFPRSLGVKPGSAEEAEFIWYLL